MKTAVMLVGFGGPTKPKEVRPFLDSVLNGVKIPQARYNEVLHHYEVLHGISPYNEITSRQKKALLAEFSKRNVKASVFVGYRHSSPSLADTLKEMKIQGVEKVVAFVLASLRSKASFDKYAERVVEAQVGVGAKDIQFFYTRPFHVNPLFIEAQAEEVTKALKVFGANAAKNETAFIFSAHSIPTPMAKRSGYDKQFEKIAELIAGKLGIARWIVAYQSRSGNPADPWLEPSVEKAIGELDTTKYKNVLLIPAGFLCDNVEVVYDLDIECLEFCKKRGLNYGRAATVGDHPKFIRLMADLVESLL